MIDIKQFDSVQAKLRYVHISFSFSFESNIVVPIPPLMTFVKQKLPRLTLLFAGGVIFVYLM